MNRTDFQSVFLFFFFIAALVICISRSITLRFQFEFDNRSALTKMYVWFYINTSVKGTTIVYNADIYFLHLPFYALYKYCYIAFVYYTHIVYIIFPCISGRFYNFLLLCCTDWGIEPGSFWLGVKQAGTIFPHPLMGQYKTISYPVIPC